MSTVGAKLAECERTPRTSEAGFGLASWFKSTLVSVEKGRHAGMSYTTEFQVVATPATRLGYSFVRLDIDVGASGSWDSTHRLTAAIAPPAGDPVPIPVYQVPTPETAARLTTARPRSIPRPAVETIRL